MISILGYKKCQFGLKQISSKFNKNEKNTFSSDLPIPYIDNFEVIRVSVTKFIKENLTKTLTKTSDGDTI